MTENLGACGLDCAGCGAHLAYKANDQSLREKVAKEWSEMFHADIKADDVNCAGCMQEGQLFNHCQVCEIRKCVVDHKIDHCAQCEEFACERITEFMNMVPQAKENLTALRG